MSEVTEAEGENVPGYYEIADEDVPDIKLEVASLEAAPPPPPLPGVPAPPPPPPKRQKTPDDPPDETPEEIEQDFNGMLDQANDALESFASGHGRFPNSLQELLDEGELTMAPKAPPGKRLSFDRSSRKFVYVDE